jgi:DNA polymerase-3 subunit gamma/tau
LALYRKYRPATFAEVVGQDDAVALLQSQLADGKVRQSYLISGPHGTGKTTLARLLADGLGCTGIDLYEADAGSSRGIDDVRQLQEMAMMMPMIGTHRVFILDEAHQFTEAADNALLKTLEEPPSSAVFILCTTEPQKVKATVRSRCQQIQLKRPTTKDVVALLSRIVDAEGIGFVEAGALGAIAEVSKGSMRDAVSLLDQLASSGPVSLSRVAAFKPEATTYVAVLDAVAALKPAEALELIEKGYSAGGDPTVYLNGLLDHLRQVLTVRIGGRIFGPEAPKIQAQAKRVNPDIVREFARALIPATDVVRRVDMRLLLMLAVIDTVERFHEEK